MTWGVGGRLDQLALPVGNGLSGASAVEKARQYLRKALRGGGELPPSAHYFTRGNA